MDRPVVPSRVAGATPSFVDYPVAPDGAPNVVVVVLDDVGFAQLGCFGSTIATPNMDRLAARGLRYNRFHVTAVCSASRAALLTGRNHHAVGMGVTEEAALGFPGYTGRIPASAATLARVLRDGGYNTMAVGKWHLTPKTDYSAAGPYRHWPLAMGFERYYGFLGAETSQWAPELVRDNTHVDPPRTPEEGYHLTEDLVDEAIRMVQDQQQAEARKPFFLYLAPGAAHAPHQVPEEWVEPYAGAFDGGWEAWREQVFERQVAAGVVPEGTVLPERPAWIPDWDELPADQRRLFARYMEVFAGFMTHTDHHLGRLFDYLEERGIADDTLVIVTSDNGASGEGGTTGTLNEAAGWLGHGESVEESLARIDDIGGHDGYNHYPFGWAWAGNTPLRMWKRYSWLGGTRTPLILDWGARVRTPGAVRDQFCHAVDVFTTVLEAAGIPAPDAVDGIPQQPIDGGSMLPSVDDAGAAEHRGVQYFEMMGSRGIYADGWKAVTDHVPNQFGEREVIAGSHDFGTDRWSLFRLTDDFSEAVDLADDHPDVVRRLEELWWAEAGRNQVLPLFEFPDSMAHMHPGAFPQPGRAWFTPGGGPVHDSQLPMTVGGFEMRARIVVPDGGAEGVVTAIGDRHGGWAWYLLDGRPVATFAMFDGAVRLATEQPLAPGPHELSLQYLPGTEPRAALLVDGEECASAPLPGLFFFPNLSTGAVGMLVGRDRGLSVSEDYRPPFAFTGDLLEVELVAGRPGVQPDDGARLRAAVASD
ncbi:arylsulfatase [Nocardioides sp. GY 10113]|uniref:arylsulfatase n=1 Tax=Nocardioides sp. GY 10113 TaxID=2569761 RepID=UPI0010A82651|nr:arylsulfatase [Nocardioides sp. GY 10113]TIC87494.1 arylsulfatase [Nocardioides sp. GY 10113]